MERGILVALIASSLVLGACVDEGPEPGVDAYDPNPDAPDEDPDAVREEDAARDVVELEGATDAAVGDDDGAADSTIVDSTIVDSTVVDSTIVDSTIVDSAAEEGLLDAPDLDVGGPDGSWGDTGLSDVAPLDVMMGPYVAETRALLAGQVFVLPHSSGTGGLLDVFEFDGGPTFSFRHLHNASATRVERGGSWGVSDLGYAAVRELDGGFGTILLNTATPSRTGSTLKMPGYRSYNSVSGPDVETWLAVQTVTAATFMGKKLTSVGTPTETYEMTSASAGTYTYGANPGQPFTWYVHPSSKRLVIEVTGGSQHLYLTERDALANPREIAFANFAGSKYVGGDLRKWTF